MRHHILRMAGLGIAVVLAICLGAVVVAMTGGPQAPLTQWAAPRPPAGESSDHAAQQGTAHATTASGAAGPVGTTPGERTVPSASAGPSVTPATSLPATNSAGRTPPGQVKSPNPHKPSVAA
jgi:hypothetical protein